MSRIVLISVLLLSIVSCKKPEDRKCIKGAGDEMELEISVPYFKKLWLGPHIKYVLVQDVEEKVVVKGGKNLLNFITTNVENEQLTITNENKCNFLRSYKKEIQVEIHLRDLIKIEFEGTKELTCANQLIQNDMIVVIRDGAGKVNMNLNANSLSTLVTHGWGNFDLRGEVDYLKLEVNSNGFGTSTNMAVNDSIYVVSKTAEQVNVNASNALMRAEIGGGGDIYYIGTPSFLESNIYGTGELVDNN